MAIAEIIERSTPQSGGLYVLVGFWENPAAQDAGVRPHVESFHFASLQTTKQTPRLDRDGNWMLVGGGTFDPTTISDENPPPSRSEVIMDTVQDDPKPKIFKALRSYANRLTWPAATGVDRSDRGGSRDSIADPRGLLAATSDLSLEGL